MKYSKRLIPFLLLMFLFIFTACGNSLEKPTGLENNQNNDIALDEIDEEKPEKEANESKNEKGKTSKERKDEKEKKEDKKDKNDKKDKQDKQDNKNKKEKENKEEKQLEKDKEKSQQNNSKDNKSNKSKTNKSSKKTKSKSSKQTNDKSSKKSSNEKNKSNKTSSKKSKNKGTTGSKSKSKTVTLSIKISSDEVPLGATKVKMNDGDTVLDVFNRVTKEKGIQRSVTGSGSGAYVAGIANVYEFDRGDGSGWMYRINGVFPDRGVGSVKVQNGDKIEFLYTTDLGKDLNADLQPYRR